MSEKKEYELALYTADFDSPENKESWIRKAFAPLKDYLKREFPKEQNEIINRLMFMGHGGVDGTDFIYKNELTREYIIISVSGRVVKQEAGALL